MTAQVERGVAWTWPEIEAMFPFRTDADGVLDVDRDAVEDFLRLREVQRLIRSVTVKVCHRYSVNWQSDGQDFEQQCYLLMFQILTDPAVRARALNLREGLAHALYARFCDRVKAETESAAWLGSRGMSTQVRRRRALASHADRMRDELGREPSKAEVVESFNAKIIAARKDAGRQGMIATIDDLESVRVLPLDTTAFMPVAAHEDDMPLATEDAKPLVAATLRRARGEAEPVLLQVIEAWLGHLLDSDAYLGQVDDIVAETGLDDDTVRNLMVDAVSLCRQVAADEFGVAESDFR